MKFTSFVKPLLTTTVLAITLSACHTMQGLGQDIQRGGEKLEEKAHHEAPQPSSHQAVKRTKTGSHTRTEIVMDSKK